jgi:hypothetical protein
MRCRVLLVLVFVALIPSSPAAGPPHDEAILERFTIAGDGDHLIVPVTIKGRSYPFILDTGCTWTIYDKSLRHLLGTRLEQVELKGAHSTAEVERYPAPPAAVGKLPFPKRASVLLYDFAPHRRAAGRDIRGLLGMDFFQHHIIRIDFDAGLLTFYKRIRPEGQRLFLYGDRVRDVPYVDVAVGTELPEEFIVDTGCIGEGVLGPALFKVLSRSGKLKKIGESRGWALEEFTTDKGRLAKLKIGPFEHQGAFLDSGVKNLLGLGVLSRYRVTFDFPRKILYLRKGKNFARPSRTNRSGLCIHRPAGVTVIKYVEAKSAAAKAGIKPGDVLVSIGELQADRARLHTLWLRLSEAGKTVPLTLKRNGKPFTVQVHLASDVPITARAKGTR